MKQSTYFIISIGESTSSVDITKELEEHQNHNMTHIPKTPKHIIGIDRVKQKILSLVEPKQRNNIDIESQNSKITTVFEAKNRCIRAIHTYSNNAYESIPETINLQSRQKNILPHAHKSNIMAGQIAQKDCLNIMADFLSNELSEFETRQQAN